MPQNLACFAILMSKLKGKPCHSARWTPVPAAWSLEAALRQGSVEKVPPEQPWQAARLQHQQLLSARRGWQGKCPLFIRKKQQRHALRGQAMPHLSAACTCSPWPRCTWKPPGAPPTHQKKLAASGYKTICLFSGFNPLLHIFHACVLQNSRDLSPRLST